MQVPSSDRVRRYELTYLIPGSFTSDLVTQTQNAVDAALKKHQSTVVSKDEWGKKSLAYPIKHVAKRETEATYVHLVLEMSADKVAGLDSDLHLNQQVLRYLLIIEEKQQPMPVTSAQAGEEEKE